MYLLVASESSVHRRVDDSVQAHGEWVDVLHLPHLALSDQGAQLQSLILYHLTGILQRTHFHLESTHRSPTGVLLTHTDCTHLFNNVHTVQKIAVDSLLEKARVV